MQEKNCAQIILSSWMWAARASRAQRRHFDTDFRAMNDFMISHFSKLEWGCRSFIYFIFSLLARIHYSVPMIVAGMGGYIYLFFKNIANAWKKSPMF